MINSVVKKHNCKNNQLSINTVVCLVNFVYKNCVSIKSCVCMFGKLQYVLKYCGCLNDEAGHVIIDPSIISIISHTYQEYFTVDERRIPILVLRFNPKEMNDEHEFWLIGFIS